MSAQHESHHEELAAIAAVEGLGVLGPADADQLDHGLVGEYEHAAGALFAALAGAPLPASAPRGMLERIEAAVLARAGAARRASGGIPVPTRGRDEVPRARSNGHSPHERGRAGADGAVREPVSTDVDAAPRSSSLAFVLGLGGWFAAAAAVVFLVIAGAERGPLDPAALRAELPQVAPDTQVLAWGTEGIRGDVTWSDARNEGVLRLAGLAVNDPTEEQYQLWIFRNSLDAPEDHPVDGGVFDVTREGEVLIPIDARIPVRAQAFVVTREKPGGVVVSDRERIEAVAERRG